MIWMFLIKIILKLLKKNLLFKIKISYYQKYLKNREILKKNITTIIKTTTT